MRLIAGAAAWVALAGAADAGPAVAGGRPWTATDEVYTLHAWDFSPLTSTYTWEDAVTPPLHRMAGNGGSLPLVAGVRLPAGAVISGMELSGCSGPSGPGPRVTATIQRCLDPDGACEGIGIARLSGASGCLFYSEPLSIVARVDNLNYSYVAMVATLNAGSFRGLRIFYRQEVSPAPATATFSDVPTTDPRFRFVEALAAAGITAGCGGGQFCPEASVTRGQMAVFLSVALGLYWPN